MNDPAQTAPPAEEPHRPASPAEPDRPARPAARTRRPRGSQAFWSVVVAVPAALSLLRLWVEAGGQVQTTLLLVENVSTVNLFATMFVTGTRLVSMGLVTIFAIGSVLGLSANDAEQRGRPLRRLPLFARWADVTPLWLLVATFVLALATWPILYLPLLLPAFVMAFQTVPSYRELHPAERLAALVAVLVPYTWLIWPTLTDAWRQNEYFALAMFVVPPLLAPVVSGPVPRPLARLLAAIGQPAIIVVLVWAIVPVMTSPVLPLTVTTLSESDDATVAIRGYIINTDDEMTAILQESGGVRYVHNKSVAGRVLCPSPAELPVYRLRVRDFHVEDSLLEAWGRRVRPVATTDAACRNVRSPR